MSYNPYDNKSVAIWHLELTRHIRWIIQHVGDYFIDNGYTSIKMLDIGCCSGRMVECMNARIPVSEAILIDAISELVDFAKELLGDKYSYEACAIGNTDGMITMTLPEPHDLGINLGGATASRRGLRHRENVPLYKFDTLWKSKYLDFKPDLVKIDVEGLDIDALEGMQEFLTSLDKKPLIVYEIAGINMSDEAVELVYTKLQFLTDMGYKPLWDDSLAPKKSCDLVLVCN